MIQKLLNTEEVSYYSNLKEENLKKKVEELFEQKSLGLTGKLTSEYEFMVYDRLAVIGWHIPNMKRKSAYLKGEITQGKKGSLIKLKVNPNSVLPVFALLAMLSGVIISLIALFNNADEFMLIFGIVIFVLGSIYYPVSTFLRNRLRNKVVAFLELNRE